MWAVKWRESRTRFSKAPSLASLLKKAATVCAKVVPTPTTIRSRRDGEKRNGKWKSDEPGIVFVKLRYSKEGNRVFVAP